MPKNEKNEVKILIMGLSNSGKTSIVLSLQKNVNLLSFYSLEPTKGIDRVEFEDKNSQFHIWDFGGQEQYRDGYLKNLNNYLTGVNKFIYVIDVQDEDKYDVSLQYFKNIFTILKKEKFSVSLSIFLHKYDPNLEFDEESISELIMRIRDIIPNAFEFNIFKTSIYTVFRKILAG